MPPVTILDMTAAQPLLSGMPDRLFPCTPTRLTTWVDCPRRYLMVYLARPTPPKGPPWAHNSLGASIHMALASWWRLPFPTRTARAGKDLLEASWIEDGFRDGSQSSRWKQRAGAMVETYLSTVDPGREPVGVERTVGSPTGTLALSGRVDRIDLRPAGDSGDELVVVDYKTGRRPPTESDTRGSLSLALYAVATARVFRRPARRVELHHIPTGQVAAWEHTSESLARQVRRAEDIAADIVTATRLYRSQREDGQVQPPDGRSTGGATAGPGESSDPHLFPAHPGPLCGWCDFRHACEAGRAFAAAKPPWAGLEPFADSTGAECP